jgi:hypothetical protein
MFSEVKKMGRSRTPTNVLDAKGAFKKNPNRQREDATPAGPLGSVPAHMSKEVGACWLELTEKAPHDVLTMSDEITLELAATLLAQFRANPLDFPAARLARLHAFLSSFGMTPADRSKVGGQGKKRDENMEKMQRLLGNRA